MLALLILFAVVVMGLSIPNAIVNQIVTANEIGPDGTLDAEAVRALARHPANLVSNLISGLLFAASGTLLNVLVSATIAVGRGFREGLAAGFSFIASSLWDVFKLYLMYLLLLVPLVVFSWIPQLIPAVLIGIIVGCFSAAYLGYISLANLGLAASLFAAKTEQAESLLEC
jgi:hypothetical protein